jgi:hypothetical protein
MEHPVKQKVQRFEGLGWYSEFHRPLWVESERTINERGNTVVTGVNSALTFSACLQPEIVSRGALKRPFDIATTG